MTVPLLAVVPVPAAEAPTSNGLIRIQAAVFQGADVDEGRGRVEGHCHGIGSGRRRP